MAPATPPTSSHNQFGVNQQMKDFKHELPESKFNVLETPKKSLQQGAPVTPSTTKPFKHSAPMLVPPTVDDGVKSPFKGFLSPEYTPNKCSTGKRRPLQFEQPKGLQRISRVLFPKFDGKHDNGKTDDDIQGQAVLLPSAEASSSVRRRLSNDFKSTQDDEQESIQYKHPKQLPGTPSHKVVTYKMAENWHNSETYGDDDSDDDLESLIGNSSSENPFMSSDMTDEKTREQRKMALLCENPDIENVVTYLDKKGNVVKRVHLSQQAKEIYKPKRLFDKELKEEGSNESE